MPLCALVPSQLSQIVLAPFFVIYSQPGISSFSSSLYEYSVFISESTYRINGVDKNPVPSLHP